MDALGAFRGLAHHRSGQQGRRDGLIGSLKSVPGVEAASAARHHRAATCVPHTASGASAPTSNAAGWRCCSSRSWRTPPPTPGATPATNSTAYTWRNTRHELDRLHQVTLATPDGYVTHPTRQQTNRPRTRRTPRFLRFTPPPAADPAQDDPAREGALQQRTPKHRNHIYPSEPINAEKRGPPARD